MPSERPPCVHYIDIPHSLCLIGRTAPADCARGCAGYLADIQAALGLDAAERTRRAVWSRVMGVRADAEEPRHA